MKVSEWNILKMIVFRENMGSKLFFEDAERIYGKAQLKDLDKRVDRLLVRRTENPVVARKLES